MISTMHAAAERQQTGFVKYFSSIIRYLYTFFSVIAKGLEVMCGGQVTVQTGSKLEAFFAAFSRKTRVQRRAVHAKRIGITARKRYMSTPFEGAWTVTSDVLKIICR